jgi:hypothetical protein
MPKIIKDTINIQNMDNEIISLPGILVQDVCPNCSKLWTFDGDDKTQYVTFPVVDGKIDLIGHCDCGTDWSVEVNIGIKISL